jgi:hypothetical protein
MSTLNKHKLIHIIGDSKFGGGTVVIMQLAKAAQRIGFEVDILTTDQLTQEII